MSLLDFLTVNKYYKMNQAELEKECSRWKIGGYATEQGRFVREWAIKQLIEKDKANDSRYAVVIAIIALVISVIALFM